MRILQLLNTLQVGGAERLVATLSDQLIADGIAAQISPVHPKVEMRPGEAVRVSPLFREEPPHWPVAALSYRSAIKKVVEQFRPDVVHCHAHNLVVATLLACRKPIVYTVHSTCPAYWTSRRSMDAVYRAFVGAQIRRGRVRPVTLSERSANVCAEKLSVDRSSISIVANGTDLTPWEAAVDSSPVRKSGGAPEIVWLARMEPEKNPALAVRAAACLRDSGVNFRLTMCGDGSRRMATSELSAGLGLDALIDFPGAVVNVTEVLRSASMFWMTSGDHGVEGHPIALIEAMAAGLPVVATEVAGISEHLAGRKWARMVAHDSPDALAKETAEWLSDPQAMRAAGSAAKEESTHYSIVETARCYRVLYEAAIHGSGTAN